MAKTDEDNIDFNQLEKELEAAISADVLYWQQNDAKIRAVTQGVPTYEDFRQMVNAAHLKPLEKHDKFETRPKSVWNTFASKKKNQKAFTGTEKTDLTSKEMSESDDDIEYAENGNLLWENCFPMVGLPALFVEITSKENMYYDFNNEMIDKKVPTTFTEFTKQWQKCYTSDADRFEFLKELNEDHLRTIFQAEIGFGLLGEILKALLQHSSSLEDAVVTMRILEILPNTKRFGLTLQFMSASERNDCKTLFAKLHLELGDNLQDLAEQDITEWSIKELAKKYEINL